MRRAPSSLALLVALGLLLALTGCGTDDDPPGDGPVTTPDGFSRLDDAGIAQIKETGKARLDLRDHALTRSDLGLGADSLGPVVGSAGGPEITLTLVAPDGTEEVRTSTFSVAFNGSGEEADYLTWFESHDSTQAADTALGEDVERWGLRRQDVTRWQQTLDGSGTDKVKRTIGPGVSPSGLVVEANLSGSKDGGQTHQLQVLLDPALYEPTALEQIRRTGQLPG